MMLITPPLGQRPVWPAKMAEMLGPDLHHRMADRAEIVDQGHPVDAKTFGDQCRADDPGIVGELQHIARDRAGHGYGHRARQSTPQPFAEDLPRGW